MSRAQQAQVGSTAAGENQTFNQDATNSFKTTQGDIGDYATAVGAFRAQNPYGQGGQAETAENQEIADTAAGGAQAAGSALQSAAVRTGQNTGGAIAATEDMQAQNERALAGQEATATQQRLAADTGYNTTALNATAAIPGMENQVANEEANASQGALNTQEQAAQTPSFLDELGQGLITAGSNFAGGFGMAMCPAKGSLYLMADGSEKPVEKLEVGQLLKGIDGEPEIIEEIQSAITPVLRVVTDDGFTTRNSRVHAFALPAGGFVVAMFSLGKTIVTAKGRGKVISVTWDGEDEVFNVITDGSHTYRADGVWALGVGEAERHVSMDRWNEIGDGMAVSHV
jgi:hypothetical protein